MKTTVNGKKLQDDYMISVTSLIDQGLSPDEPCDKIDFMTRGSYVQRGGSYYITYEETETIGYAGCVSTIKVAEDGQKVTLMRFGTPSSTLIVEKGRRNLCHYETPYGSVTMGITADDINSELNEKGGKLAFSYVLDANSNDVMSRNSMEIWVRHIN